MILKFCFLWKSHSVLNLEVIQKFKNQNQLQCTYFQQIFQNCTVVYYVVFIRAPSPPPKKRKREEVKEDEDIPHILQGEIARLGSRFRVNLDPTQHSKSKDVHLVCKIGKYVKKVLVNCIAMLSVQWTYMYIVIALWSSGFFSIKMTYLLGNYNILNWFNCLIDWWVRWYCCLIQW